MLGRGTMVCTPSSTPVRQDGKVPLEVSKGCSSMFWEPREECSCRFLGASRVGAFGSVFGTSKGAV